MSNPASGNAALAARDLKHLWHPCTQMKDHEQLPLIPIKRGEGVWLEDFEGKRYLDAVSSWWVNVFGHANPRINQRIKDQVDQLEHVISRRFQPSAGDRAVRAPGEDDAGRPDRVFYADNGSSCIEVALKMSFHYWLNRGQPNKKRFVTLTNSYHGETMAAMSVGDVPLFTEDLQAPLLLTPSRCRARTAYEGELGRIARTDGHVRRHGNRPWPNITRTKPAR